MKTIKGRRAVQAYYDNYYLDEHREYLSETRTAQEAKFLIKSLGREPSSVCDVGCGDGRHLKTFQQAGVAKGFGFDLSSKLVGLAKQNLSRNKNFVVENMSFTDWQPEQEAYDITYSVFSSFSYCLDFVEAQGLVGKMVSATAAGGIICIDVDSVFRLVRFLLKKVKHKETDELEFDAADMQLRAREERGGRDYRVTVALFRGTGV